jgi:hypothetical protein
MSIWDELSRDTGIYFARDAYNMDDPTIHIWIGDYPNLYGDSACLELASPLIVVAGPEDVVPLGNLCPTCMETLTGKAGWIAEAMRRSSIAETLGVPVASVTAQQVHDFKRGAAKCGASSRYGRSNPSGSERERWA